jgi:hypothetical protein
MPPPGRTAAAPAPATVFERALAVVVVVVGALAVASTIWWSFTAVGHGLYWDDVNDLGAVHDLITAPLRWSRWGELLSNHPPTAFLPHLVALELFGSAGYAAAAHVLQAAVLVTLIVLCLVLARAERGAIFAAVVAGLALSWPIVASDARESTQDLWIAAAGFGALMFAARGRVRPALAAFALACLIKLTAVGFLPGLVWLLRKNGGRRRDSLLALAFASYPVAWVILSAVRGGPSRHFDYISKHGYLAFIKGLGANGVRHLLELFVFDGRWVLTAGLAICLAWFHRTLRQTWRPLDTAMALTTVGMYAAVTVFGGTDGLERYLVPLAVPLAWISARVLLSAPMPAGVAAVSAAIAVQLVAAWAPYGGLTALDRRIGTLYAAFTRASDAAPVGVRDYVDTRERVAPRLGQDQRLVATWPMSVYLSDPAAGFVKRPADVIDWTYSGSIPSGDLVVFDVLNGERPTVLHARLPGARIFGSHFPLVVTTTSGARRASERGLVATLSRGG